MWVQIEKTVGGLLALALLILCAFSGWLMASMAGALVLLLWHPWRRGSAREAGEAAQQSAIEAFARAGATNILTLRVEGGERRWMVVILPSDGSRLLQRLMFLENLGWLDAVGDDR